MRLTLRQRAAFALARLAARLAPDATLVFASHGLTVWRDGGVSARSGAVLVCHLTISERPMP